MGNSNSKLSVLLVGIAESGKTSIVKRVQQGEFVTTTPTQGFNVTNIDLENHGELNLWDLGGQPSIIPYWKLYYDEKDAVIFVIDSSDEDLLEKNFELMKVVVEDLTVREKPFLILLNKSDLPNRISTFEFISKFNLCDYFKNRNQVILENKEILPAWFVVECSALTGQGIRKGLQLVCSAVQKKPVHQVYHNFEIYKILRKIHSVGWRPSTHLFFPKVYRSYIWSLLLISNRMGLSLDSIRGVLSFIEIEFNDGEETKEILDDLEKNMDNYQKIDGLDEVFQK